MEKNKILSPKLDVVFHMIFGEQKNERITKKLIEDVISERVERIELEQMPYLWGEQFNDKLGIIDIKARINGKNLVNIEMQILDNKDIEKRILYYWAKLYTKQLKKGEHYLQLERCISIIFLDYELENLKDLPIHTIWNIKSNENGKTILTKDLEIHIIEIPKVKRKLEDQELKKWILFLENPEGEEIRKMAEEEKEIKEAMDTLEDISSDEQKLRIAELRQKYILDKNSELRTAEEKGIEKGKKEMAKRMLEEGLDISIIEKITNLTKEEIKKLD